MGDQKLGFKGVWRRCAAAACVPRRASALKLANS